MLGCEWPSGLHRHAYGMSLALHHSDFPKWSLFVLTPSYDLNKKIPLFKKSLNYKYKLILLTFVLF